MRRQLLASGAAVATAVAVGLAMVALPAVATHVQPIFKEGNPTCSKLAPGTTELKIEPVESDTYSKGAFEVTIEVYDTPDGPAFDWTSNFGVDAVFVKGGPNGNLYVYSPEATSDTGLHAPVNPKNETFYGLSHISFCYDKDVTTPPSDTPTKTPTKTPTESPTKTPTESPTKTPTESPTTPAPVPTEVPAGANDGTSGSPALLGMVLAGSAAMGGAAVVARRRFLHDS